MHAQPLGGYGVAVLAPGMADGAGRYAEKAGEPFDRLGGGEIAFADLDEQVLAPPIRSDPRYFCDLEILGNAFEPRAAERWPAGR